MILIPLNYITHSERSHDPWRQKSVGLEKLQMGCVTRLLDGFTSDLHRSGFEEWLLEKVYSSSAMEDQSTSVYSSRVFTAGTG